MPFLDEDRLYKNIEEKYKFAQGEARKAYSDVLDTISEMPSTDVEVVRHGRWMYCGKSSGHDHVWQCSECLRTESTKHKSDIKDYPYCHCGARMDGKE